MSGAAQDKGFWLWVETWSNAEAAAQTRFTRALEDYAEQHGLCISGGPLLCSVCGLEHELSLADQVHLIDWLLALPLVRAVAVTPFSAELRRDPNAEDGLLRVPVADFRVAAVCVLYRLGHLRPEQYIELLGGFVRRVH
jgi:hypothetical protein